MADIVISIAAKIAEYLVDPIERRLSYLFSHRGHIHRLQKEVVELMHLRDDVRIAVEEAIRRGDEIRPIVQHWLTLADEITMKAQDLMIDENKSCFNGWCPNLKSRYRLSKKAQKMSYVIAKIQFDGHLFDSISYPAPPILKNFEPLESRASTLEKIMDALRDDEMKMIGVWGMGGVGKTTLVKQVVEQARQAMLFTTQVYINVSWTRDSERIQQGIAKIQQQIADMLRLKLLGKDESTRALQLKQRMNKERVLIILDDLWKVVDLERVGIRSEDGQKECKIILASRDRRLLCQDMGAQKYFPVKHLPPEEAWSLFKKIAGDSVESFELRPIAIEVVEECDGLPVAIVTIAKALKGESVAIWENALEELRRSSPTNIRGMGEKVYSSLTLSYDHLEGEEVKLLFLLCGMRGYGDISMDDLSKYVMGSDLFEHISSLDKLMKLVKILNDSSLLLDVEDGQSDESSSSFSEYDQNKFVRMHRVVCAVARAIASKDPHWFALKEALQSGDGQRRRSSENALVSC
ncbi:Disease resistance protein [Vitis vinifera]|uniref:Disease resistance protein n=1 Tax=Vitis vinifera TaxID=29760 RepID=A0A438EZV9_VITVI|nr:Disease resistance protein [Vitis vinifera]